jgi:protein involved in polysaccharide export with SLBB domain
LKYAPGESLTAAVTELVAPKGVDASASGDPFASVAHSRLDLHRIRVERDGATLGTYDVVSLAAHGNAGPLLQPGDTIAFENKPSAVRILGAVKTPGTAYVSSDESLTNAIEESGGILDTAATSHVLLQRGGTTQSLSLGDSILSAPAVDGDVLTVPTAPRISVVGVVAKPGVVALKTDFSLLNAIYQAGGPLKQGDLAHVSVIRSGAITRYDVSALVHGDTSQNPVLSDGDVVFVPQGKTSFDFFAVLQAVSPIFYLLPRP